MNLEDLAAIATSGAMAGFAKTFVSHPLDTVKVHVQNNLKPPGSLPGLYRGIGVPLARNGFEHSLHFFLRSVTESVMGSLGFVAAAANPFLVGFVAGFPQAVLTTPMDYLRLQLQLNKVPKAVNSFRGLPWVTLKESVSGMIFFGVYEFVKCFAHPGIAGSAAALSAMLATYPVDTFKTRVQAGQTVAAATQMSKFSTGLPWAVAKCLCSNFVALSMYEAMKAVSLSRRTERSRNSQSIALCPSQSRRTHSLAFSTANAFI
ncbi:hypothetical protein NDN08_008085 [Rhodosorus marinus]|uniref:ADP,ATP carrier protein n=1 Tax=Rhodosorus marinus TaxID=101924 RepID=A0AAV8UZG2_9RHOD|nr:hypothetical protein NDN08_008085 [Rhodosorus marinus]